MSKRDFDAPEYRKWRLDVYKRDGFKCKMPGCGSKSRLAAHHIRRWADAQELRYVLSNGITLCYKCHKLVQGKEDSYADLFFLLISDDPLSIKRRLRER